MQFYARWIPLCCLLACNGSEPYIDPDEDTVDSMVDTVETSDTSGNDDEENPWDTSVEGDPQRDTYTQDDPDIGVTPIDGTWWGTFTLTQELPLSQRTPVCTGDVDMTVSGSAQRHVLVEMNCPRWTPQPSIVLGRWGPAAGFGFATLNPENFNLFSLDVLLRADQMPPIELTELRVNVSGDTMVSTFDNITGILGFREGQRFEMSLQRGTRPPPEDPPIGPDTADPVDTDTDSGTP